MDDNTTNIEIILIGNNGETPFVTKKDNKYYICDNEYADDINLLLHVIENVKNVDYPSYCNTEHKCKSLTEYYQNLFNYSWSINIYPFYTPTNGWNVELTRRGELYCPYCNTKMVMHYVSYCPLCNGLIKYEHYDFHEMLYYVAAKYKIEIAIKNEFSTENAIKAFVLENYLQYEIMDGILVTINWKEVYELAVEENDENCKYIAEYFYKEFGDNGLLVVINY